MESIFLSLASVLALRGWVGVGFAFMCWWGGGGGGIKEGVWVWVREKVSVMVWCRGRGGGVRKWWGIYFILYICISVWLTWNVFYIVHSISLNPSRFRTPCEKIDQL